MLRRVLGSLASHPGLWCCTRAFPVCVASASGFQGQESEALFVSSSQYLQRMLFAQKRTVTDLSISLLILTSHSQQA